MTLARDAVSVLVPAAGNGQRLGLGPKAGLLLAGRPVLDWVVDKAMQLGDEVLVACQPGLAVPAGCIRVDGGATRQDSVLNLVRAARRPWLLVWDAARPFGSVHLARAVLDAAGASGAAGAWLPGGPGTVHGFQTPLAFSRGLLLRVLERAEAQAWVAQSTMELVQRAGHAVGRVPGEAGNIKLTTPGDWQQAQAQATRLR